MPFLSKLDNIAVIAETSKLSLCEVIPEIAHKVITIPNVISVSKVRDYANESIDDIIPLRFIMPSEQKKARAVKKQHVLEIDIG